MRLEGGDLGARGSMVVIALRGPEMSEEIVN